jgi:hypothetical protein
MGTRGELVVESGSLVIMKAGITIAAAVDRMAARQGKARGAHLDAHLAQMQILSAAQEARYAGPRGYPSASHSSKPGAHRH